jgi:hypothetical protein
MIHVNNLYLLLCAKGDIKKIRNTNQRDANISTQINSLTTTLVIY